MRDMFRALIVIRMFIKIGQGQSSWHVLSKTSWKQLIHFIIVATCQINRYKEIDYSPQTLNV